MDISIVKREQTAKGKKASLVFLGLAIGGFLIFGISQQVFSATTYILSVTKSGNGGTSGQITSSPAGIDCGLDCFEKYSQGTAVTLTAISSAQATFNGWSGACSGKDPRCVITINQATEVTANFIGQTVNLSVTKSGTGFGKITSSPTGIDCGTDCSEPIVLDTEVVLNAKAATGSTFSGWSGACSGSNYSCTIKLSEAKTVGARFNLKAGTYPITVSHSGPGKVISSPSGIDCGDSCQASFSAAVTLTAVPDSGASFQSWSGSCAGSGKTCAVYQAVNTTAIFQGARYRVTITKEGSGTGTITSSSGKISCGSTCSGLFDYNSQETLTAAPSGGSSFTGWISPCAGLKEPCTLKVTGDTIAKAVFNLNYYTLSVSKTGTGLGKVTGSPSGIDCGSTCSRSYIYNSKVALTAAAADGSEFLGWSGVCSGKETCTVSLKDNTAVTANFSLKQYTMNVSRTGSGQGKIVSSLSGIDCGTSCSGKFGYNTRVTLTAVPEPGSYFNGWSGDCSGSEACVLMTAGSKSASASFTAYTLFVDLSASPASGYNPFKTNLTAKVSGTAIGTVNYTFWWNCDNPSVSVEDTVRICGNPDGVSGNQDGIKFDTVTDIQKTVANTYEQKTSYRLKVIAERNAFAIEKRLTVNTLAHTPFSHSFSVRQPDYCGVGPSATFFWGFSDPKYGDSQSAYRVQVDNNSEFSSPEIDEKTVSDSLSYTAPRGKLAYARTYYWRMKVWDKINNEESPWISSGVAFTTPLHKYPVVDFSWLPENPKTGENISLSDESVVYGGTVKVRWSWKFPGGNPLSSSLRNPQTHFVTAGPKNVTLEITDSDNYTCAITKTINLGLPSQGEKKEGE